jgi:hypothetical protein
MEVSGWLHALTALPSVKEPLVPLDRRLDGPQSKVYPTTTLKLFDITELNYVTGKLFSPSATC